MTQGTGEDENKITMSGEVKYISQTDPNLKWGLAGLSIEPDADMLASLKAEDGFLINFESDGKWYRVEVATSDITDYSYFKWDMRLNDVNPGPSPWNLPFSDFQNAGWGQALAEGLTTLDKSKITHITITARPDLDSPAQGEGTYNLTIWDITPYSE